MYEQKVGTILHTRYEDRGNQSLFFIEPRKCKIRGVEEAGLRSCYSIFTADVQLSL